MAWKPSKKQVGFVAAAYGALTAVNVYQNETNNDSTFLRVAEAMTTDHLQDVAGLWNKEIKFVDEDAAQGVGGVAVSFALEVPEAIQAAPSPRNPIEF